MKQEVLGWLQRARKALRAARVLRDSGFPEDAVSRAYYAMFYSAKALTVHQGQALSKHRAVISAFGRDFARTGALDPALHLYLREAYEQRGIADYTWNAEMRDKTATEHIKRAEEFLAAVEAYLQAHSDAESTD
jgi:uncharacterized protein (UPF0332 family)